MWRQQLGDLLKAVLSNVKRKLGTSKYMPFQVGSPWARQLATSQ